MKNNPIVYVLVNDSMPNLFKIGKSSINSLDNRVKCLSSKTGVPTPFKVLCYIEDKKGDGFDLETKIFLDNNERRINKLREFFIFDSCQDVITMMRNYGNVIVMEENIIESNNSIYSSFLTINKSENDYLNSCLSKLNFDIEQIKSEKHELIGYLNSSNKTIDFYKNEVIKLKASIAVYENDSIRDKYKKLMNTLNEKDFMIQSLTDRLVAEHNSINHALPILPNETPLLTKLLNYVKLFFHKGESYVQNYRT